jgi:hypothetical protein
VIQRHILIHAMDSCSCRAPGPRPDGSPEAIDSWRRLEVGAARYPPWSELRRRTRTECLASAPPEGPIQIPAYLRQNFPKLAEYSRLNSHASSAEAGATMWGDIAAPASAELACDYPREGTGATGQMIFPLDMWLFKVMSMDAVVWSR